MFSRLKPFPIIARKENAEDRSPDRTFAAVDARSTDDDRGDHKNSIAIPASACPVDTRLETMMPATPAESPEERTWQPGRC